MRNFFTVTNFLNCKQTINLDYLIGIQEVREGDEQYVTVTMVHPTDQTTAYDIRIQEDYTATVQKAVQAGYM